LNSRNAGTVPAGGGTRAGRPIAGMVDQRNAPAVAADSRVSARLRCRSPIPSASRAWRTSSAVKPSARISSDDDSSRRATRAAALTASGATTSQPIAAGSLAGEVQARWSATARRITPPSWRARRRQGEVRVGDGQLLGTELLDRQPQRAAPHASTLPWTVRSRTSPGRSRPTGWRAPLGREELQDLRQDHAVEEPGRQATREVQVGVQVRGAVVAVDVDHVWRAPLPKRRV
jgi:hypothetical protein